MLYLAVSGWCLRGRPLCSYFFVSLHFSMTAPSRVGAAGSPLGGCAPQRRAPRGACRWAGCRWRSSCVTAGVTCRSPARCWACSWGRRRGAQLAGWLGRRKYAATEPSLLTAPLPYDTRGWTGNGAVNDSSGWRKSGPPPLSLPAGNGPAEALAGLDGNIRIEVCPGRRGICLFYTSEAAGERSRVDLGGGPHI